MDRSVSPRATAWAGGLLVVAAAGPLIGMGLVAVPLDHGAVLPLHGEAPSAAWAVLRLAASAVLAVGAPGVVGGSRAGRLALVGYGAQDLVLLLDGLLLPGVLPVTAAALAMHAALQTALLAAGIVAAGCVVRARRIDGDARWLLVPVVALDGLRIVLSFIPLPLAPDEYVALSASVWPVQLVLLLALAAALLLHGRRDALRHRWRVIRDAW